MSTIWRGFSIKRHKGLIWQCNHSSLKVVNKFNFLGSSISSTETDIDTRLGKAWRAIHRLSVIWKTDLTDKMKCSFFQAAAMSILLYGCTTWTLTKRVEKKLNDNYTSMLRAILNKYWRKHPTKRQLYAPPNHPSRKLSKLDEQSMQDNVGEYGRAHKWCTPMDSFP